MNSRTRKSLLQSYYRQRRITAEQGRKYEFKSYEINKFVIKNNLIDISKLDTYQIAHILSKQSQLIHYFKDRFDGLNGNNISYLLSKQPQLIDYFKGRLGELNNDNIYFILIAQPQLIHYFKGRLGELGDYHISEILYWQPQLKPYFE